MTLQVFCYAQFKGLPGDSVAHLECLLRVSVLVRLVVFRIFAGIVAELVGYCVIHIGNEKVSPCFIGSMSAGCSVIIMSSASFGLCDGQVREARGSLFKVWLKSAKCFLLLRLMFYSVSS